MQVTEQELRLDFFELLYGEEKGYVVIATQGFLRADFIQEWFEWPHQTVEMLKYIDKHESSKNIWFGVNLYSAKDRHKEFCMDSNVVWADLDEFDPEKLSPPPQVVIESSPDRFQAIWRLTEKVDPYIAEDYSRKIYHQHKDEGVDSGWAANKILRVPYTTNLKYSNRPKVLLKSMKRDELEPALFDAIPDVDFDIELNGSPEMPKPDELPDPETVLYKYAISLRRTAFQSLWEYDPKPDEDWSGLLWRLIMTLHEVGMENEEILALTVNCSVNKYARDKRPLKYLWRDILKGEIKHKRIALVLGASAGLVMPELIPGEQYQDLPKCFVDDYRAWGEAATDACPQYHDLCAFILLSALLAGNLKIETSYTSLRPNLWGLILGDSTLTRKTTVMNMTMEFISNLDRDIIVATAEGSGEGLLTALQTRSGKTSVFKKDEVTGFFESMKKKDYLSGMQETLTELYDVPPFFQKRLRKEIFTITNPVFILFCGGIKDKMFTIIDETMVLSGFLPRFLIVSGEADIESLRRTGPATLESHAHKQEVFGKLSDLYKLYNISSEVEFLGQPATLPVEHEGILSPDAWELYGEIEYRMVQAASVSVHSTIMLPTFERLSRSMLKMALLIAASRQTPQETLIPMGVDDIRKAASYIQLWGNYSLEMLENLGRNTTMRLIEKILDQIKRSPGILRGDVMRGNNLTRRDMNEIQDTLEDRGQLNVQREGRGTKFTAM